jgi:hypothetical protein
MGGSADSSRHARRETERKLLAALCQPAVKTETRGMILHRLRDHNFSEPDYEVVFKALAAFPMQAPSDLRQALIQAITRMGFPDLDLSELFEEYNPTQDELQALLATF